MNKSERGSTRTVGIPHAEQLRRQQILERLARPVTLEVQDVSLRNAVTQLLNAAEIPAIFDEVRVTEPGNVDLSQEVSLAAEGESVQSVLDRVLRPHELTWIVRSGGVVVTMLSEAESQLETVVYDVTNEIVGGDGTVRSDRFESAITQTIRKDEWQDVGGASTLSVLVRPRSVAMVVRAPAGTQRLIADLLSVMREMGASAPPQGEIVEVVLPVRREKADGASGAAPKKPADRSTGGSGPPL